MIFWLIFFLLCVFNLFLLQFRSFFCIFFNNLMKGDNEKMKRKVSVDLLTGKGEDEKSFLHFPGKCKFLGKFLRRKIRFFDFYNIFRLCSNISMVLPLYPDIFIVFTALFRHLCGFLPFCLDICMVFTSLIRHLYRFLPLFLDICMFLSENLEFLSPFSFWRNFNAISGLNQVTESNKCFTKVGKGEFKLSGNSFPHSRP